MEPPKNNPEKGTLKITKMMAPGLPKGTQMEPNMDPGCLKTGIWELLGDIWELLGGIWDLLGKKYPEKRPKWLQQEGHTCNPLMPVHVS